VALLFKSFGPPVKHEIGKHRLARTVIWPRRGHAASTWRGSS